MDIRDVDTQVDLITLDMIEFDVIFSMEWSFW